jgi:hypothetical protein
MSNDYRERMIKHLSEYKKATLRIAKAGIFNHKGKPLCKEHILPLSMKADNFLPMIRQQYPTLAANCPLLLDAQGQAIKWHRYAHHLNSSQALAVNLFQPLLQDHREILGTLLRLPAPVITAGFEKVFDPGEGTNVDFFAESTDGQSICIEIKLTEQDFGKAKDDERHRDKFTDYYRDWLMSATSLGDDVRQKSFFAAYQFYRNARLANAKQKVWFLLPEQNSKINELAEKCLGTLRPEVRQQVEVVGLTAFLEQLCNLVADKPDLKKHYEHFKKKYLLEQ